MQKFFLFLASKRHLFWYITIAYVSKVIAVILSNHISEISIFNFTFQEILTQIFTNLRDIATKACQWSVIP